MRLFALTIIALHLLTQSVFALEISAERVSLTTDYSQDPNCVAAWRHNSTSTPELDRSSNGADLTYGNNPASVSTFISGFYGKAVDFEGTESDYLTMADEGSTDVSGATSLSIVLWFDNEEDTGHKYVWKYNTTDNERQFRVAYLASDNAVRFIISSNGTDISICLGATDVNDGEPHHIAAVYDYAAETMSIYIDGVLDSNGADNPKAYNGVINDSTAIFYIGTENEVNFSDGKQDETGIFDRALSLIEINNIIDDGLFGDKGAND